MSFHQQTAPTMCRNQITSKQGDEGTWKQAEENQGDVVAEGFLTQTAFKYTSRPETDGHSLMEGNLQDDGVAKGFLTQTSESVPTSEEQVQQEYTDHMSLGVLAQHADQGILPTPINIQALANLLKGFDADKKKMLVEGFTRGFTIPSSLEANPAKFGYTNHKTIFNNLTVAQSKINKELELGRIAGPFDSPPFRNFIVSPLGLVPKKNSGEYRLIHDLSFPKGDSVNGHIDPEFSAVQYEVLDRCIELVQMIGFGCLMAKADLKDAFRIIPVAPSSYRLLGFTWNDKLYYDRCLPMGCSISCQTFEFLSQALQWILVNKLSVQFTSHILDDFIFFGHPQSNECLISLHKFLSLSECVNLPVKQSKTVFPSTSVVLHGILVDTLKMQVSLPQDKVDSARLLVSSFYRSKKVQLRTLQSLIGVLNFACRVVVPGRAFLRRLINLTRGVTNPVHFIKLTSEARKDLQAWKIFLDQFNGRFLCLPNKWSSSNTIKLYTDASGFGFAAVYGSNWFQGRFPDDWKHVNIAIKELLPISLAVRLWGQKMANSRILFMSDNISVVQIINSQTSRDSVLMDMVRSLVVSTMTHNIDFKSKHIPGKLNIIADGLSRFQVEKVFAVAPWLKKDPQIIPAEWLPWESPPLR